MADHRMARLAASAALLLATVGGLATAPSAHAAPQPLLSCQGTETLTFQPPLTNTPKPTRVSYAIDLSVCPVGGVTSGTSQGSFTATASCTALSVLPPAFSDTYHWNTGASSTVSYTAPVETAVNGTVTVTDTGTVNSGLDHGSLANETTTLPQPDLTTCAGPGVARLSGPYALTFG
ncbi:hypothetical protein ABT247_13890 [Kitasatospora sp. NPDC001539]|uniref:hypothetical protein n=1 Tax=Kitasatospora sp. NPDC001539 TaxID=3154384 RepID=UPI003317B1EF